MTNEQTQQDNTPDDTENHDEADDLETMQRAHEAENEPDGTEGIIGTYCPIRRGWWFNGDKVPRFEPVPEDVAPETQPS